MIHLIYLFGTPVTNPKLLGSNKINEDIFENNKIMKLVIISAQLAVA